MVMKTWKGSHIHSLHKGQLMRCALIGHLKQLSDWLRCAAWNVQCQATPEIKLEHFLVRGVLHLFQAKVSQKMTLFVPPKYKGGQGSGEHKHLE